MEFLVHQRDEEEDGFYLFGYIYLKKSDKQTRPVS